MRSKKLLAALLTLCMLVSVLSPAANAVAPGKDAYLGYVESEKAATKPEKTNPHANELAVSGNEAEGLKNLRDDPINKVEVQSGQSTGAWSFAEHEGDISADLTLAETPDCIEELRQAAEIYASSDRVVAFVVMEQAPLADLYSSNGVAAPAVEQQLLLQQEGVINTIESEILEGEELDVRYQFTYLTNSFSIMTEFGNLEKIATIEGVKSVYLMPVYTPCTTEDISVPFTTASGELVGAPNVWADCGYTGTGMRIAVIDTGLDLDHPSFAANPATNDRSMTVDDIAAVLTQLNAYAMRGSLTAESLYRSVKVPYAFNYVDENLSADHSRDTAGDHGTHVAGIAAANAVEGSGVVGMAPDAQIIVMKVFGANGGAYADDIVAALEDAMTLDCDVVNLSLGSPAGFSSVDPEIDAIYARIAEQDIIVAIAAGNEGTSAYDNMWGTNLNATEHPDNSTVSSPATYMNATAVASADNTGVMRAYFTVGGERVAYNDGVDLYVTMAQILGGESVEYVVIPGLGEAADFEGIDVSGKIALIQRGTIAFSEKLANAEALGAVGVVIYNNIDETIDNFGMSFATEDGSLAEGVSGYVPAVIVEKAAGEMMIAAEEKVLTVSDKDGLFATVGGGQMSSFSSWGATPDLRLLPDITGIGGNVYSCYDNGQYGLMSGTSMASPQVAGVSALVLEYIHDKYPTLSDAEMHDLAEALLMSTAAPVISSESGVEASPRQQGSGLVDAYGAVTTEAYLTVGGEKPKAELYDGNGDYAFTFEVHNIGSETKTFTLSSSLLTEDCVDYYGIGVYFMAGYDRALSGSVTFSTGNTVTVAAGSTAYVTVNVSLSAADKAWLDTYYPEGGYVEGFVYLQSDDAEDVDLSLPFMGFYGDWTEPDLFDSAYWYDNSFWDLAPAEGFVDGDEFWHILWTDLQGTSWVLGLNPYSGAYEDENGNIAYDPAHNVVSPNGDGALDGIDNIYLSLMRNARSLTMTYTIDGEVVFEQVSDFVNKTMFISGYGQVVPYVHSWYYDGAYDFTDANGIVLPDGTEVLMTITGKLDYGDGGEHVISIPFTVDTSAPVLVNTQQRVEEGVCYLDVYCDDNVDLAAAFIMNDTGTRVLARKYDNEFEKVNGMTKVTFNVTGLGAEFVLALTDYGCNESYYDLTYTEGGQNLPVMDQSLLYAYRLFDREIYSDYMYGWVNIDKETALVEAETSDYLEYYAMIAAEYAGGYVFAVDAGNNLLYLIPGIWNRNQICTLDYPVIDMAFDEVNQVMYVITKDGYNAMLQTLDLLTGELTPVADFGYYYYAPWAITCDDEGTLYAVVQNKSNLFIVTWEDGEGVLTPVTVDDVEVQLLDSNGNAVSPNYSQSMTYSKADDKIYWAYYSSTWRGEVADLIAIDLTDYSSTATAFAAGSEYVGVMTLEDDGFVIEEATALDSVWLTSDRLVLNIGDSASNSLNPIPWNYALGEVTWESSDPSVATVENGVITAVSKGDAIITATSEGIAAECLVTVVDISGDLYAYDYFNVSGEYMDMVRVDLSDLSSETLFYLENDLMAGDYNGHTGYIYGYAEGGQLMKVDPVTGEAVAVGASTGIVPLDMAYDYNTGVMYAITVDNNMYCTILWSVNLNNGQLYQVALIDGLFLTLACDANSNLYGVNYWGDFAQIIVEDGFGYYEPIFSELGEFQYMQSMCYDHQNNVFLWACPEHGTLYWVDPFNETPYLLSLGDPTGSGMFEFTTLYTIPDVIPELPYVAVEEAYAEDMVVLVGQCKAPNVTILPLNATNQSVSWTSSDESVVSVDENGNLVGVSKGEATITGVLNDEGTEYDLEFTVMVIQGAENLYGHIMTDIAFNGGQYWVKLYPEDTKNPEPIEAIEYVLFSEEYYNGKLYAYGYDPDDWSANWQYFVINPVSYQIEEMYDMGEGMPFVYDMTYDYSSSTMYCTAGVSSEDANLYIVDVDTGKLILCMKTQNFYMGLAAGADGKLYGMRNSVEEYDPFSWSTAFSDAELYVIDPVAQTETLVGSTGIKSNKIASLTYDYDNDWLYWTPFFEGESYVSSLSLVDPETAQAYALGTIGTAGAQVSGLYTVSDSFPEEPELTLNSLILEPTNVIAYFGAEPTEISAYALPLALDGVNFTWTSSDESIATVEDGMVTALTQGSVVITVTAEYNGVTLTAQCHVAALYEDAALLSYNVTDNTWAYISRKDVTQVTNLDVAYDGVISAYTAVDGVIYGYDADNNFFQMDPSTSTVSVIGNANVEVDVENEEGFEVRGMAYDTANDRMLVLGAYYVSSDHYEVYDGCGLYTVDMQTGELTLIYVFTDYTYVKAMAVDDEGMVYFYSTFNDYVCKLDTETFTTSMLVSLQTQSIYGDSEYAQTMYYDSLTKQLMMLVTSNGTFYNFCTIDPAIGTLTLVNKVGEVTYNSSTWRYDGDVFLGLADITVYPPHDHELQADVTFMWSEDHSSCTATYVCGICGEHSVSCEITSTETPGTCTVDGSIVYEAALEMNGQTVTNTYTEVIPASGHTTHVEGLVLPTCGEDGYTGDLVCDICGAVVEEGTVMPATGEHEMGEWVTTREPTDTEPGEQTRHCHNCDYTETRSVSVDEEEPPIVIPPTGDNFNLVLVLSLLGVSVLAIAILLVIKFHKPNKK